MFNYKNVIDNSKSYQTVKLDVQENRISHAYLFASQDENYLYSFIEQVAITLINLNEKNNIDKNILRIQKHIHPDVKIFGYDKQSQINVQIINSIIDDAQVCPFEADKKIIILLNFQDISEICQNKLLKIIEEPPENTFFILGAKSVAGLLPTIQSRVKEIILEQLSVELITQLLIDKNPQCDNIEIFANCSNGNSTFAEKLTMDNNFIDFFNKIVSCYFDIKGSKDVFKYSNIFSTKNIDVNEFFDIATLIARDLSMILTNNTKLVVCKNILPKLKVISASLNLDATSSLIMTCLNAKKDMVNNANQVELIDCFLFKLAEVKVKCRRLLV